jgi:hypothetical protein
LSKDTSWLAQSLWGWYTVQLIVCKSRDKELMGQSIWLNLLSNQGHCLSSCMQLVVTCIIPISQSREIGPMPLWDIITEATEWSTSQGKGKKGDSLQLQCTSRKNKVYYSPQLVHKETQHSISNYIWPSTKTMHAKSTKCTNNTAFTMQKIWRLYIKHFTTPH